MFGIKLNKPLAQIRSLVMELVVVTLLDVSVAGEVYIVRITITSYNGNQPPVGLL